MPADGETLKRVRAGEYRTVDERFTVEQSLAGWMVIDHQAVDDLGLPLTRGPLGTLDEARAMINVAREGPAPLPGLADRAAGQGAPGRPPEPRAQGRRRQPGRQPASRASARQPARSEPPPVVIRETRASDGRALRALWIALGMRSLGDDDRSLARLARRNPGLVLVATQAGQIVGSALGAWDGRRGWIYHVATAPSHRGQGIAARLVQRVETGLAALGCPKVNVIVLDDNVEGRDFWAHLGYVQTPARQFGRELRPE
jgi:ribosomal protein S18 acetylase RimI-like enzyme